jgi:EH_Signature domain
MDTLFAPLPPDFDQLALAVRTKRGGGFGKDPDLRTVGERTYSAFEAVQFEPLSSAPRQRDWRHIPYALWLSAERGLHTQPQLTEHYFGHAVPKALDTRRPLKWGRGLLHAYLQNFNPQDATFQRLAQTARQFFLDPRVLAPLAETEAFGLERLITTLDLLDPINGPIGVANDILTMPADKTLQQWQERHALTAGFWLNNFCRQAFIEALKAPEAVRRTPAYIQRMCEWAIHSPENAATKRFRYPICRDEFAYNLLSPWFAQTPPPEIKTLLMSELLRTLGDPRHDHAGWLGVRSEAIATASRWLTGRTLDAFFEILRHTEDDIGPYRRAFWQAYYHAGHITEAWVSLGEEAAAELAKIDPQGELSYAKILGKIAPKQSVLMLRIGHILFCDWSHQGRLRAIAANNRQAPKLYQAEYELHQLRFATTLDFNQGRLDDPGLLHHESASGGWQSIARDFIAQHLGIDIHLSELLPSENPVFKNQK